MGNKVTKVEFDSFVKDFEKNSSVKEPNSGGNNEEQESRNSSIESQYVNGLDSFEFTWNRKHPLRRYYVKLKRDMYSKYDCLNHDNVDIKILVDEILIIKTQLSGVGKMVRDGLGPKNIAYRVSKHQTKLIEIMTQLMKYTRKEPEKAVKKTLIDKGKKLANDIKDKIPDDRRETIKKLIKEQLASKYASSPDDDAPFEGSNNYDDESDEDNE